MRYAIIQNGGKQYKAVEGQTIEVDRMDLEIGKKVDLKDILLVSNGENALVGSPKVSDAKVTATVVDQIKGPKVVIFKYRPRKRYRVKTGHRQLYTRLMIDSVEAKDIPEVKAQKVDEKVTPMAEKAAAKPKAEKKEPAKKASEKKAEPKKEAPSTRKKLSSFDISDNTVELLEAGGISTVNQFLKALEDGEQNVLDIKGIGPKSLEDVKKLLKKEGYSLS